MTDGRVGIHEIGAFVQGAPARPRHPTAPARRHDGTRLDDEGLYAAASGNRLVLSDTNADHAIELTAETWRRLVAFVDTRLKGDGPTWG
jgi:hypothetical protein